MKKRYITKIPENDILLFSRKPLTVELFFNWIETFAAKSEICVNCNQCLEIEPYIYLGLCFI